LQSTIHWEPELEVAKPNKLPKSLYFLQFVYSPRVRGFGTKTYDPQKRIEHHLSFTVVEKTLWQMSS